MEFWKIPRRSEAERLFAADLAPSPIDRMLAAGGVVLAEPTDAARCYPGLWPTGDAARKALARAGGGGHSLIEKYLSGDVRQMPRERRSPEREVADIP